MAGSYLVKRQITVTNSDNEGATHYAGDVLSDWELPKHIKDKVKDGVTWYVNNLEALTDKEAELYRKKATAVEGKRTAPNREVVDPPWDDYIGLHPRDVIDRMKDLTSDDCEKVRQYERAGLNRSTIIEYVAPSEREPWHEYDSWGPRDILEKLEIIDPQTVQDVIVYEMNHKKRPAILTFEAEEDGDEFISTPVPAENEPVLVGAGVDNKEESKE